MPDQHPQQQHDGWQRRWLAAAAFGLLWLLLQPAMAFNLSPQAVPYAAPPATFRDAAGNAQRLANWRGRRVMLWLFSTWCHTCVAGVRAMAREQSRWQQTGLVILAIRNHDNDGVPGTSMARFLERFAPDLRQAPNWIRGEASAAMAQDYNPRHFPDVYFLIDQQGVVQQVDTAPQLHLDAIAAFASGRKGRP